MDQINKDEYMTDSKGRLVPKTLVSEIDKARDDLVLEILEAAKELQKRMRGFKIRVMDDIQAFVSMSVEQYDVKLGGQKGNVSLVSFDGKVKIQLAISERLVFDERLQAAKKLIDECITKWSQGSRDEIKALINDAFQVDKEGKINTNRVIGLRRLAIDEPKWRNAMMAISDSLQVAGSKSYIRIYNRIDTNSKWKPISLDMASI